MNENGTDLLCIGNAIVDVFAKADEQLFARYGITLPAQHVEIEKISAIISDLPEYTPVSGGGAANVAKIAAFLGAKTHFTGAVNADSFGRLFEKDLTATGVKLTLRQKAIPTGICLVLRTKEGNTRIVACPSASLELSENDISEDDIKKANLVVLDGFMLGKGGLVRHILRLANKYEKTIALDLSSVSIARNHAAEIAEFARQYPLILFMNEEEALAYAASFCDEFPERTDRHTEALVCVAQSFEKAFSDFSVEQRGKNLIFAVKLGSRGAVCFAGGKIYRNKTKAIIPVETTGAGDAFCAGFLTAWVRNKTLSECAAMGNKAAALVLGAEGSQITPQALKDWV